MTQLDIAEPQASSPETSGGIAARIGTTIFLGALIIGLGYMGVNLFNDLRDISAPSMLPFILLGVALLIALGFEFVNGFHDTANAVATVIYTNSLPANLAVVWSGACNFLGVLVSTGAVAFGIVSLLPVELILQVGSEAGFAMVFALLIAAIVWNLGTWYLGLPSSSSHTLVGSIIGVGLMNQLMAIPGSATSGVDWTQATKIIVSLVISPLIGFICSAILLRLMRALVRDRTLFTAPEGKKAPPAWIRGLLILTCSGVSFAHGSNDGQKGMGLIMLILIGTVPTAYALNRTVPVSQTATYVASYREAAGALDHYATVHPTDAVAARAAVEAYVRTRTLSDSSVGGLEALVLDIAARVESHGGIAHIPNEEVRNVRNDLYLSSEALRLMGKTGAVAFGDTDKPVLKALQSHLETATRFIPGWVKVAVALALGLGTMVGWKRIVVTVGEKIGKDHLNYGQGASAELVAMVTIGAADAFGLPVSTTHVLSSGVAGTMYANGSGVQMATVRNMAMAWVLTLPVSIVLSGSLFWLFRHMI